MRTILILTCLLLVAAYAQAAPALPVEAGQRLSLAEDDWRLQLQREQTWTFSAEALGARQVVLNFRARIDNPSTIGSTNMLRIALNGQPVGLKTPRRQTRLLSKPNRFEWTDPPFLTWWLPQGQWRLAYAPDFEILAKTPYYTADAYHCTLDVTDLIQVGENALTLTHTGNPDVARNARSDLSIFFRDLHLEVRPGPGVEPGVPDRLPRWRPFQCGTRRSAPCSFHELGETRFAVQRGSRSYVVTSTFTSPQDPAGWNYIHHGRDTIHQPELGRVLVRDRFSNSSARPLAVRIRHEVQLPSGRCERVSFGGREEPSLEEISRPECPYLFLPHGGEGVGIVAYDDVLRTHAALYFDDTRQAGGLRDDWFGLPARGSYEMTWAVYTTTSGNVFDLVNLVRRDWDVSFPITGGINFFEPDSILAYDDQKLKEHLETLNINITMSQGGWVDRKLIEKGEKNIGHGPVVWGPYYADYRLRLKAACDKLRRLRPRIKCLIYYDTWLVAGAGIKEQYGDSFYLRADGRPRNYQEQSEFGFPLANVTPTLDSALGQEILAKLPPMLLDEIGADGLYWDEIGHGFQGNGDYAHPLPYTYLSDARTGEVKRPTGAPDLASQPFKLALMKALFDRGAMIVGNGPPTTATEQRQRFTRFTETDIPHYPGLVTKTWLYTPVSYAGWSTYKQPDVSEEDFLADIREKLWNANLYLYSAPMFYHHFTHENLTTFQYPITVQELDEGVIIGKERILTLRPGRFGWPREKWRGEVLMLNPEQRISDRWDVTPGKDGCVPIEVKPDWAAVLIRK